MNDIKFILEDVKKRKFQSRKSLTLCLLSAISSLSSGSGRRPSKKGVGSSILNVSRTCVLSNRAYNLIRRTNLAKYVVHLFAGYLMIFRNHRGTTVFQ